METGSIVKINYTAKEKGSGDLIDTTSEKVAIKEGVYNQEKTYKPQVAVIGEQELPKTVEDAITNMNNGETKTVVVPPLEAFGERNSEYVAVVPLKEFRTRKISPAPGLVVDLNGKMGKVQSVSGGRVRVDFNHPLAGKDIEYAVTLESIVDKPKEQIELLFEKYFAVVPEKERKMEHTGKSVAIHIPGKYSGQVANAKQAFAHQLTKHVKGVETVSFTETFEKEKDAAAVSPSKK
jgi:FKBP-type peptidyl-prolyl cis-trans isomerase SlyD